jgi:hypothetical protein
MPDLDSNRLLLQSLRERGFTGEFAVVARDAATGRALEELGVRTVLYPMHDAVDHAVAGVAAAIRGKEASA